MAKISDLVYSVEVARTRTLTEVVSEAKARARNAHGASRHWYDKAMRIMLIGGQRERMRLYFRHSERAHHNARHLEKVAEYYQKASRGRRATTRARFVWASLRDRLSRLAGVPRGPRETRVEREVRLMSNGFRGR